MPKNLPHEPPRVEGAGRSPSAPDSQKEQKAWINREPSTFSDADQNPMPRHLKDAMRAIQGACRGRCYTFTGFEKLAPKAGCQLRRFQMILKELSEAPQPWVRVIDCEPGRYKGRIILLLRRVDEDLPVFDPNHDSVDDIQDEVRLLKTRQRTLNFAQSVAPISRNPLRESASPPKNPLLWSEDDVGLNTTTTLSGSADGSRVEPAAPSSSFSEPLFPESEVRRLAVRAAATVVELHGKPDNARERVLGSIREFGPRAIAVGLTFDPSWLDYALAEADKRARKDGKLPAQTWNWIEGIFRNHIAQRRAPAKPTAPPSNTPVPKPAAQDADAQTRDVDDATWGEVVARLGKAEIDRLTELAQRDCPRSWAKLSPTFLNQWVRAKVCELASEPQEAAK
jgi:hypothetical protein